MYNIAALFILCVSLNDDNTTTQKEWASMCSQPSNFVSPSGYKLYNKLTTKQPASCT